MHYLKKNLANSIVSGSYLLQITLQNKKSRRLGGFFILKGLVKTKPNMLNIYINHAATCLCPEDKSSDLRINISSMVTILFISS